MDNARLPASELRLVLRQAGDIALTSWTSCRAFIKPDRTISTDSDLQVEKYLRQGVLRLVPDCQFLGEEGCGPDYLNTDIFAANEGYTAIVDPIDGTESYFCGLGSYAVSLALYRGSVCVYAGLYNPLQKWLVDFDTDPKISWPDSRQKLSPLLLMPSNYHEWYRPSAFARCRALGSICYHALLVFQRLALGFVMHQPKYWDVAAVLPLISHFGLELYSLSGTKLDSLDLPSACRNPHPLVCGSEENIHIILGGLNPVLKKFQSGD